MIRCALYARYSSDNQRDASIEDQLRLCREHAEKQGWRIAERATLSSMLGVVEHDKLEALLLETFATELKAQSSEILGFQTGSDSYLRFDLKPIGESVEVSACIEKDRPYSIGEYPLTNVYIEFISIDGVITKYKGAELPAGVSQSFSSLPLPPDVPFKWYTVRVFARNGHYQQDFYFKKHVDGTWYAHALRYNDLHHVELRQEEFQPGYPERLKTTPPTIEQYLPSGFDRDRKIEDTLHGRNRRPGVRYGLL